MLLERIYGTAVTNRSMSLLVAHVYIRGLPPLLNNKKIIAPKTFAPTNAIISSTSTNILHYINEHAHALLVYP